MRCVPQSLLETSDNAEYSSELFHLEGLYISFSALDLLLAYYVLFSSLLHLIRDLFFAGQLNKESETFS